MELGGAIGAGAVVILFSSLGI
jgi:ribonuclease HI